jgi:hypothetical protein
MNATHQNEYVKNAMGQPHLIQYVRDDFGNVKGVAVALGKTTFGWSVVAPADYIERKYKTAQSVPAIAHMLRPLSKTGRDGAKVLVRGPLTWDEIVKTKAFQKAVRRGFWIPEPKFDRLKGLEKAFHRAEAERTQVKSAGDDVEITGEVIRDTDLWEAIATLKARADKVFK